MDNTVRAYIDKQAQQNSDDVYVTDPNTDTSISFGLLQKNTIKITQYLVSLGYEKNTSIAFASSNNTHLIQVILGVLYGGFRAVSVNLVAGQSIISYVLSHSDSKLVLCDDDNYEMMRDVIVQQNAEIEILKISELLTLIKDFDSDHSSLCMLQQDDDGLLIYTSGTTGKPKGVVLSHANLVAGGKNTIAAHQLSNKDIALCSLPLYHINAFCVSMMSCLLSGQQMIVPHKFSPSDFWNIIHRYKCSWFSLVPTQIAYILHQPCYKDFDKTLSSSIRFGRSASSALAPALQEDFEKKFQVYIIETMGLSETAAQITSNPLPPAKRKIGSPGVAVGNEIKVVDEQLKTLSSNEVGEILIKGDNVMKYYLKNEQATNEAITKDEWLRTGDLGKIDEEGYLFVTGRLKELIIKGGENIAPREIDEVLYTHPDVIEAAAFACPCDNYGQEIEACVVTKEEKSHEQMQEELMLLCHKSLGKFKSPLKIHCVNDLPKGPSGKVQRLKLYEIIYKDDR